jgi:hypothetical protein
MSDIVADPSGALPPGLTENPVAIGPNGWGLTYPGPEIALQHIASETNIAPLKIKN